MEHSVPAKEHSILFEEELYLEVNKMDAIGGPEVVGAVELEEEQVGHEEEGNPADIHVHQQIPDQQTSSYAYIQFTSVC